MTANSTCRLQLNRGFGFREAGALVPYLHALGITDLYLSPITAARTGSLHGYDVVDPTRLNPDLGSPAAFSRLAGELKRRGMGLLLDIVPNHMAAHTENQWWMDVLRHGPRSRHAAFFDIRWGAARGARPQVALPVLASDYESELEAGALRLSWEAGEVWLRSGWLRLPLDPRSVRDLIGPPSVARRRLRAFRGRAGDPSSFQRLHDLIERQHYRLTSWRRAGEEVNYRRFFSINDLVSVRVEDPRVFDATHRLYERLAASGRITGLRVDHIDGLADPLAYLRRLRARAGRRAWIVVEKILMPGETLPAAWPVAGTTGYDMLNHINEVMVDRRAAHALDAMYQEATGDLARFNDVVYEKKKRIIETHFPGELRALTLRLARLIPVGAGGAISGDDLEQALMEATACLPVYRTYVDDRGASPSDRRAIRAALREAARRGRARASALSALGRVLLPAVRVRGDHLVFLRRWQQFSGPVMAKGGEDTALYVYSRLLSLNEVGGNPESPGMSVEAFHRAVSARARAWPRSMNATATHDTKRGEDVRARIDVLSEIPEEWGARLRRWRQLNAPRKKVVRGMAVPDGREEFQLYQMLLGAWPLRAENVEPFRRRFASYLTKAAREAKVHTRWRRPVAEHEEALVSFMNGILTPGRRNRFLPDFLSFQQRIAWHGAVNGLASVVIKMAVPGVADLYQGCELWDLRLVDPDNRRPVDWDNRRRLLGEMRRPDAGDLRAQAAALLAQWPDGRIKMHVTSRCLQLRRANPVLFREGDYIPIVARGPAARHVLAFARRRGGAWVVAAVARLSARLGLDRVPLPADVWGPTTVRLPPGAPRVWTDALTGRPVPRGPSGPGRTALAASGLFADLPVVLLFGGSAKQPS